MAVLTNSVNVFIHFSRHVVIDDVVDAGNVEAASSDSGGDKNRLTASPEVVQSLFPLPLSETAGDTNVSPLVDVVSNPRSFEERQKIVSEGLRDIPEKDKKISVAGKFTEKVNTTIILYY